MLKCVIMQKKQRRFQFSLGASFCFTKGLIFMKKPIIGVTPLYDSDKNSYWMLPGYLKGIETAGGIPIMLGLTSDDENITESAKLCDGFLFAGGQDVSPSLYGETPSEKMGETCKMRDDMEKILLRYALTQDKPILGICRGIQFLNAYLGGTLYQDIPKEHPSNICHSMKPPYNRAIHNVFTVPLSPLEKLLNLRTLGVNSYHHQAIKKLAPSLSEMAVSEDGITEAVFMPGKKFVWAVQWHPEFSYLSDQNSKKIFEAFIKTSNRDA